LENDADLFLFDLESYKWQQVQFKGSDLVPEPRSGLQLFVGGAGGAETAHIFGGYSKEVTSRGLEIGAHFCLRAQFVWSREPTDSVFFLLSACRNGVRRLVGVQYRCGSVFF
jgi:hypothetical protein